MVLDFELIKTLLPFLFSIGAGLVTIWFTRTKDVDRRLSTAEAKIQKLETDQRLLASHEDLNKISLDIVEVKGQLGTIGVQLENNAAISSRLESLVDRLEEHLLRSGK